jgi:hypothetical protein
VKYTINELANSKGVSQPVREALLHMEAELEATNRQVEILSDALAESRREVARLKAVQEPVAWYRDEDGIRIYYESKVWDDATPLYTTPPAAQRQWVGLTDEEIDEVTDAQWANNGNKPIYAAHRAYARAIEAKLKELNT